LILLGVALFIWVALDKTASLAFDILTQHQSPVGVKIGVPGFLLSIFGYFVAPATIGALVAAVFLTSSQVSARARQKRAEARVRSLFPQGSPDEIRGLAAGAATSASDDDEGQ
jgi:hypothetical protein